VADALRLARRKDGVRSRLIQAARELFVEQGYEKTSMEQVAERAGVSRSTCYRFFPNKVGLVLPFRENRLARFNTLVSETEYQRSAYEAVRQACLEVAGEFMGQREHMMVLEQIMLDPELGVLDRELDFRWVESIARVLGHEADFATAHIVGGVVNGAMRSALDLWLRSGGKANMVELTLQVFRLLDRGIPTVLSAPLKTAAKAKRPARRRAPPHER
jgi:AcrR family transcriptional regulator